MWTTLRKSSITFLINLSVLVITTEFSHPSFCNVNSRTSNWFYTTKRPYFGISRQITWSGHKNDPQDPEDLVRSVCPNPISNSKRLYSAKTVYSVAITIKGDKPNKTDLLAWYVSGRLDWDLSFPVAILEIKTKWSGYPE